MEIKIDTNKILKNVMRGVSALIGLAIAEGIYRAGVNTLNDIEEQKLIGDGEIISDDIIDEDL